MNVKTLEILEIHTNPYTSLRQIDNVGILVMRFVRVAEVWDFLKH